MPNWYPGQNAQGKHVVADPAIFAAGYASQPPIITAPGTAGPGTAVTNNTGFDCMVYMSATGGIGGVSLSTYGTVTPGTVPAGQALSVYVPANVSINVSYTTALTWHWLAV